MVELEEVKVLGQPISNSKIAGTRTGARQAKKSDACICEKRVASFNKTQRTEKRDSVGVVMVVFGYYLQQLVITCNNILCNILLQYFILPFEKCDEFVKLRSVGFSQQLAKKPLASWGETTTNSCRCINTAFPFFVRTVHQRENQVIHQTYLL
jgi:hypothetical protein